jgi:hypothetical protein
MRFTDDSLRDDSSNGLTPKYFKIMVVEFNTGGANFIPVRQSPARPAGAAAAENAGNNEASFETQQLARTLPKPTAEVRPEKVARAAALVADPNYPSPAQLSKLAGLLAKHL